MANCASLSCIEDHFMDKLLYSVLTYHCLDVLFFEKSFLGDLKLFVSDHVFPAVQAVSLIVWVFAATEKEQNICDSDLEETEFEI